MSNQTFSGGLSSNGTPLPEQAVDMGNGIFARQVAVVGGDGKALSAKQYYTLLTAATATGSQVGPIAGGDYLWRAESTNFNGATATLQFLGLDGTTWNNARNQANTADVTLTASGSVAVGIAQGSFMRVQISGAVPTVPLNSALGGL